MALIDKLGIRVRESVEKLLPNWRYFLESESRDLYCRQGYRWIKYENRKRTSRTRRGEIKYDCIVIVIQPPDMNNLQQTIIHKFKGNILATGGVGTLDENEIDIREDIDEHWSLARKIRHQIKQINGER